MLGEVHRDVAAAFDIDSQRVFAGALDLALALEHAGSEDFYRPLSRYPSVAQDIAVAVDEQVNAAALPQAIIAAGGELLQSVQLFDIYRGDQVEKGKKSLAFNLIYQAHDHTLTDAEVNKVHRRIAQALIHRFEAAIRGD